MNPQHNRNAPDAERIREEYRDLLSLELPPGSGTDMPGTPEWVKLPPKLKNAAVIRLLCTLLDEQAERVEVNALADDLADDLIAADALIEAILRKRAAIAVALSQDYLRPSFAELQARRHTYVDSPPVDPTAVRLWVAHGTSTPDSAPTASTDQKDVNAA